MVVLWEEPLCRVCLAKGLTVAATDVHHIIDVVDRPDLAMTRSNLVGWCHSCHSSTTLGNTNTQRVG